MKTYRYLIMAGILAIALALAFPLRDTVYRVVIVPLAYMLWVLGLVYHSVSQLLWWFVVLVVVLMILSRSLVAQIKLDERTFLKPKPVVGQVESLSLSIKKAEKGIYFKWLIANRLGKLASRILSHHQTEKERLFFDPLAGPSWEPNPRVQAYLEAGLRGSFTHYSPGGYFQRHTDNPMDHDIAEVIEYLEKQVEN
ncbi:MAG: hypothetical protein IPP66_14935 [Anaerolineales bacterium]|nr:hypothetical protein [Anaerolineales bacterium]